MWLLARGEYFPENYTKSPDITLGGEFTILHRFWRHPSYWQHPSATNLQIQNLKNVYSCPCMNAKGVIIAQLVAWWAVDHQDLGTIPNAICVWGKLFCLKWFILGYTGLTWTYQRPYVRTRWQLCDSNPWLLIREAWPLLTVPLVLTVCLRNVSFIIHGILKSS